MSKFSIEDIREVQRSQNGGLTATEAREAAQKAGTIAAVRMLAARMDGTEKAALSVATGFTPAEIDDLGGVEA